MNRVKLEVVKVLIIMELIEFDPNSIVIKTIIEKTTESISVTSFGSGETIMEKKHLLMRSFRLLMELSMCLSMNIFTFWRQVRPWLYLLMSDMSLLLILDPK